MKKINKKELLDILMNIPGTIQISIMFDGDLKLKKTNNPYTNVRKTQVLSGIVGFNYEDEKNKELLLDNKEPNFKSNQRTWGILLEGGKVVEHKDNYYLQLKIEHSNKPIYYYIKNNNKIYLKKEDIEPFMGKKLSYDDENKSKIVIRDIKFDNIKHITFNGDEYILYE